MFTERSTDRRSPRRARTLAVGLIALSALMLSACGDDDDDGTANGNGGDDTNGAEAGSLLERARSEGLTIGIANERPYGFEEGGEATGEAPELAREVLSRMDITEVDFEVVEFGALIDSINAGRFDIIAAGMFVTPERAEQVSFADPDYCVPTALAVAEGNPHNLSDFESVTDSGATLGVMSGAVEAGYATEAGVPEDQISTFQSTPDVFDALAAGRIDAVALTSITVREQVADRDGMESAEPFIAVVDGEEQLGCGAFAFSPSDEDFRDAFNEVLVEMRENDEILPIIEEFGFTSAETDAAKGVTVEDLTG